MAFSNAETTCLLHGCCQRGSPVEAFPVLVVTLEHDHARLVWQCLQGCCRSPNLQASSHDVKPQGPLCPKDLCGGSFLPSSHSAQHSCLSHCAASEEQDSSPLSSLGHKYLGVAGQPAGTGPTPACQIHPAVPVTIHPSAAPLSCCRQLLSLGRAKGRAGASRREGAKATFSDKVLPPNCFPPVIFSHRAELTTDVTRGCPDASGAGDVPQ